MTDIVKQPLIFLPKGSPSKWDFVCCTYPMVVLEGLGGSSRHIYEKKQAMPFLFMCFFF